MAGQYPSFWGRVSSFICASLPHLVNFYVLDSWADLTEGDNMLACEPGSDDFVRNGFGASLLDLMKTSKARHLIAL